MGGEGEMRERSKGGRRREGGREGRGEERTAVEWKEREE